ncbi:hypothetical protein ACFORL_12170 [Legionella dresdenensis]|uniref:Substrate of the Dot/Icm secretion system n=1 Tax=Legionella dresdenensis TaxID=450200 RepID=A0ABV8CHR9_9GAMM
MWYKEILNSFVTKIKPEQRKKAEEMINFICNNVMQKYYNPLLNSIETPLGIIYQLDKLYGKKANGSVELNDFVVKLFLVTVVSLKYTEEKSIYLNDFKSSYPVIAQYLDLEGVSAENGFEKVHKKLRALELELMVELGFDGRTSGSMRVDFYSLMPILLTPQTGSYNLFLYFDLYYSGDESNEVRNALLRGFERRIQQHNLGRFTQIATYYTQFTHYLVERLLKAETLVEAINDYYKGENNPDAICSKISRYEKELFCYFTNTGGEDEEDEEDAEERTISNGKHRARAIHHDIESYLQILHGLFEEFVLNNRREDWELRLTYLLTYIYASDNLLLNPPAEFMAIRQQLVKSLLPGDWFQSFCPQYNPQSYNNYSGYLYNRFFCQSPYPSTRENNVTLLQSRQAYSPFDQFIDNLPIQEVVQGCNWSIIELKFHILFKYLASDYIDCIAKAEIDTGVLVNSSYKLNLLLAVGIAYNLSPSWRYVWDIPLKNMRHFAEEAMNFIVDQYLIAADNKRYIRKKSQSAYTNPYGLFAGTDVVMQPAPENNMDHISVA